MRWYLLGVLTGILLGGFLTPAVAGKLVGEESSYIREMGFEERFAYVASGNGAGQVEYQGWAQPNSATSAAQWRIRRFTYDSSNRPTTVEWAAGDDAFMNIWDNRATLTY